jgi:hypothetical protein
MRRLVVGIVVAASALGVSGVAPLHAATRPACDLVTDKPGDTTAGPPQAPVPTNEPSLDIVSADVSANAKWVTTAVRVKKLAFGEGVAPDMWRWSAIFAAGSTTYVLDARWGQGGLYGKAGVLAGYDGQSPSWFESEIAANVRVTLDEQRNEIRATIARSALAGSGGVALGQRLTTLREYSWHEHTAYASVFARPGGEYDIADWASSSNKTYVAGARSCVKPGS